MTAERVQVIRTRLQQALQPEHLQIDDESHLHAGHAGAKDGRGHFFVHIVSPVFADKTAVQRHRLIYQALGDLMQTDIHAVRIEALAANDFE